jgi:hypothetical protein
MKLFIAGLIGGIFGTKNGFSWIDFMRGVCALYFVMNPLWALFWLIIRGLKWTLYFLRNYFFCCCCPATVKDSRTTEAIDEDSNAAAQTVTENDNGITDETESTANTIETDAPNEPSLHENSDEEIDLNPEFVSPVDEQIFTITGRDTTNETTSVRQTSPEMAFVDIKM